MERKCHSGCNKEMNLRRAQTWLYEWADAHEYDMHAYEGPSGILPGLDVWLPSGRQVTLLGSTDPNVPGLLVGCSLKQHIVEWPNGSPDVLFQWLCEGMLEPLVPITYDASSKFLFVGLTLNMFDGTRSEQSITTTIERLIGYLTRVRGLIEAVHELPSLTCPEAIELRVRCQADVSVVPGVKATELN